MTFLQNLPSRQPTIQHERHHLQNMVNFRPPGPRFSKNREILQKTLPRNSRLLLNEPVLETNGKNVFAMELQETLEIREK